MPPLMLCAAMDQGRLMRLSFLASSLGIRLRIVKEEEYGQTLGALCGLDAAGKAEGRAVIEQEMLVMAFFSDALIDRLLKGIRESGMGPVRLKAVLTPYNRIWTLDRLYRELQMEAATLEKRKETKA